MASAYHCELKAISRSAGRSATAAIAYRAGELIVDERTGLAHDYTRRRGIEHTQIFVPNDAPAWAVQRSALWNAAEQAETRKNSTVAREFIVAIPASLDETQRRELVSRFAQAMVFRHGVAVDAAIHLPDPKGNHRNYHAHILFSTRRLEAEGFTKKTRELDDLKSGPVETVHWKRQWGELSAEALKQIGKVEEGERWRHGYRTLPEQVIQAKARGDLGFVEQNEGRRATVHLGPTVVQLERDGFQTERGDQHRETQAHNAQVIDLAVVRKGIEALRVAPTRAEIIPPGAEPTETVLPREVARPVEPSPAEADRGRGEGNEIAEPASNARELLQRELNAELLRQAMAMREQRDAAVEINPEKIKAQWRTEREKQFAGVATKATRVYRRALGQMERQEAKLSRHDHARPTAPRGLFAGFKKSAHEQTLAAWQSVRAGIEKRYHQLRERLRAIGEYLRKAGPYEFPTKGERLAEQKATQANPALAKQVQQVIDNEKAAALAKLRANTKPRPTGPAQERKMKQESMEELKQRTGARREKAEREERAELEKAGRLARLQEQSIEPKDEAKLGEQVPVDSRAQELEIGREKGESTQEARKREILERFKEKVARDRNNDRGRGR